MIAAAGLVLALATASPQAVQRDALIARWTSAQQHAVAGIRNPKARAAAAQRLNAERSELAAPPPAPPASARDLAALAKRELATRGRYKLAADNGPPPQPSWWQRFLQWAGDRWNEFWTAVFGRAKFSPEQSQFVGTFLIALFTAVVLLVAIRLLAQVQIDRRKRAQSVVELDGAPDARALYARACERADAAEYGHAAKLLFAATVAALDLRGDVRDRTSATVREMRGSLRAKNAAAVPSFDAIARPFVSSAYAERPVRGDEWNAARAAYLALSPERPR